MELNTMEMLLEQAMRILGSHDCEPEEGGINTTECHLKKYISKARGCIETTCTVGIIKD